MADTSQIPIMSITATSKYVPPTPGPKRVIDIQATAKDRFAGLMWIQKEINRDIKSYFSEYDYWEPYSEDKIYSKRKYNAIYNRYKMQTYTNHLCILEPAEDDEDEETEYYVVAKRVPSELELLEPFCQCDLCTAFILNPLKYVMCPHCAKCIKAGEGIADPKYIETAKILILQSQVKQSASRLPPFLQKIPKIRLIEIGFTLFLVTFFIWFI